MFSKVNRQCSFICSQLYHARQPNVAASQVNNKRTLSSNTARTFNGLIDSTAGLTEEQLLVQDTALKFAMQELRPRMSKWDREHEFGIEQIKKAAELGFGGIYIPVEYGGSGLSRFDTTLIMEALAQGCLPTAAYISIHNMCTFMVSEFGNDEQRAGLLPDLISMKKFASYCLTEPSSGSDAASLLTTAVKKGDYYVVNGTKSFISGAGTSDVYMVMCRTGGPSAIGISCLVLEKGMPGLSFGKQEEKLGWHTSPTRQVIMEECKVPVANLLGVEGQGFKIAMQGINGGRLNIASTSLGAAQSAMESTITYVKERNQFGKRIADFQNTQFKLAEYASELFCARLTVREAARNLDIVNKQSSGAKNDKSIATVSTMAAVAKLVATEKCYSIIDGCLQMHGGYGYLKDYQIEQLLRDTRVNRILEGTNEIMKMVIARQLLK